MLSILLIIILVLLVMRQPQELIESSSEISSKLSDKLNQLWTIAQESLQSKKYLRAEKALLTILKVDERNASAYNRLGILYAMQKSYKDAIECFEIAQSLETSSSSLHNVGLIYFETGNYEKAALAFEQAMEIDNESAPRYIAYAKVQEKLGNTKKMIDSLEKAVELDPIPQTLNILADAYDRTSQSDLALDLREKAAKMIIPQGKTERLRQPRRVVM